MQDERQNKKRASFIAKKQMFVFLMLIFSCKKNLVHKKRAKIKMSNTYAGYIKNKCLTKK